VSADGRGSGNAQQHRGHGRLRHWPKGQLDRREVWGKDAPMVQYRPHVAVVDDDAAVRRALVRLLRTSSFDPVGYGSAAEFLDALGARLPDCLVVDLQMPGMTGLELQQHLAKVGIKIPTIVITAHDGIGTRERCRSAGASAYLLKPFQDATLIAAINSATGREQRK
jgi:FixJ family two-component response regulator